MPARRTTHRSSAGKKLYAKRTASGRFKDIQTYARAHAADMRHTSKAETAAKAKKAKKGRKARAAR
jgi:DNA-binding protein HU-beta